MTYEYLMSQVEIIDFKKLKETVKISPEILDSLNYKDDIPVAYFNNDVVIEGNLDLDTFFDELFVGNENKFDFRKKGYVYGTIFLVWVSGSLSISNTLIAKETENYSQCLSVEEGVSVKNLVQGGINYNFLNDLKVDNIFYCKVGAEGFMNLKGKLDTKIEVDNNAQWSIKSEGFDHSEYDIYPSVCDKILVDPSVYVSTDEDGDEYFMSSGIDEEGEGKFVQDLLDDEPIFKI